MIKPEISWEDFDKVDLRAGRVLAVRHFPEAHYPAYRLDIDFGPDVGVLHSSARITDRYSPEDLEGRLVVAVVNLPGKQIGPAVSECLVTGFFVEDGSVVLAVPDAEVPVGSRLV